MAKIWFSYPRPTGVPDPDDIFAMVRMNRALELAEKKKWEHEVEHDKGDVDLCIIVGDERVNDVLCDILMAGISPGTIDFDELTGVEAERAATILFEHTEKALPED